MKTLLRIVTGLCLCSANTVLAADAMEEIEQLLQERWYEVEIIVFERLDVLDLNSAEALTQTRPRQWPNNLLEMAETNQVLQAENDEDGAAELTAPSPYCLGYPLLPEPEPDLPMYLALQEPPLPPAGEIEEAEADPALAEDEVPPSKQTEQAEQLTEQEPLEPIQIESQAPQLTLTPYLQFLAKVAAFEQSLYQSSYTWLPNLSMEAQVKAINRQSRLRPVIHRRWRAPIPERDAPLPVYIAAEVNELAPLTHEGFAKLEGYISVTVSRYLHFAPTLWYHADNLGLQALPLPVSGLPTAPAQGRYMQLQQSRRMRSGDLHYLDHPKIGVVVRIDPVEIPEDLLTAWQALNDTSEQTLQ